MKALKHAEEERISHAFLAHSEYGARQSTETLTLYRLAALASHLQAR